MAWTAWRWMAGSCRLALAGLAALASAGCGSSSVTAHAPPADPAVRQSPAGLRALLEAELVQQLAALPPREVRAGDGTPANPLLDAAYAPQDFRIVSRQDGVITAEWDYRNPGDYDQNGEVNSGDLGMLARYWGLQRGNPAWNARTDVADGNGDGVIGNADITVIAQHYGVRIDGYALAIEWEDYDGNGERNNGDLNALAGQLLPTNESYGAFPSVFKSPQYADDVVIGIPVDDNGIDQPGPWLALRTTPVASGVNAPAGGWLSFSLRQNVMTRPGGYDLDWARIIVAPYAVGAYWEDRVLSGYFGYASDWRIIPDEPPAELYGLDTCFIQTAPLSDQTRLKALLDAPYDVIVIEPTETLKQYAGVVNIAQCIELLKASPGATRANKLVLAWLDIAHADPVRSYWQPDWVEPVDYVEFAGGQQVVHFTPGTPSFMDRSGDHTIFTDGKYCGIAPWPVDISNAQWQEMLSREMEVLAAAGFDGAVCASSAYPQDYPEGLAITAELLGQLRRTARQASPGFVVLQQDSLKSLDACGTYQRWLTEPWYSSSRRLVFEQLPHAFTLADGAVLTHPPSAEEAALAERWRLGADGLPGTADDRVVLLAEWTAQ